MNIYLCTSCIYLGNNEYLHKSYDKKRKQSWNAISTELLCLLTTISKSSCRFLQLLLNCSDVAYSKYHNLFFIRLLNF